MLVQWEYPILKKDQGWCLLRWIVGCAVHITFSSCIWMQQPLILSLQLQTWLPSPIILVVWSLKDPFPTCPLVWWGNWEPVCAGGSLPRLARIHCMHLFPNLHSAISCWQLEVGNMAIFTPWKLANTTNQGCHFPQRAGGRHLPAHPCCRHSSYLSLGMIRFF